MLFLRVIFYIIKYNSENNPIDLYYFDLIKLEIGHQDFDIINEKNIVCLDGNHAHLFNVSYCNDKISYNISKSENIFVDYELDYNYYCDYYINYKMIVDKINNQIVFIQPEISREIDDSSYYYWEDFIFIKIYDLNLSLKKQKIFNFIKNALNFIMNVLMMNVKL